MESTTEIAIHLSRALQVAAAQGVRCDLPAEVAPLTEAEGNPRILLAVGARKDQAGKIDRIGPDNLVVLLPGAHLDRCSLQIRGRRNLVVIGPGARLKQVHILVSGYRGTVIVGARTTWESGKLMCGGWRDHDPVSIVVGADSMLSNGVILRTSDSHGIFDAATRTRINNPESVVVSEHVWLGNGARVSKGARIPRNVVVGQMSLVTGVLESDSLYAGVPARLLRPGINWSRTTAWDDISADYAGHPDPDGSDGADRSTPET